MLNLLKDDDGESIEERLAFEKTYIAAEGELAAVKAAAVTKMMQMKLPADAGVTVVSALDAIVLKRIKMSDLKAARACRLVTRRVDALCNRLTARAAELQVLRILLAVNGTLLVAQSLAWVSAHS